MTRIRGRMVAAVAVTLLLAWLVLYPIIIVGTDAAHAGAWHDFLTRRARGALWASIWTSL